jgi:hypothetical protein
MFSLDYWMLGGHLIIDAHIGVVLEHLCLTKPSFCMQLERVEGLKAGCGRPAYQSKFSYKPNPR